MTFDGSLPSEASVGLPSASRSATLTNTDAGNMIGTVTSAALNEVQKKVHFTVTTSAEGT